MKKKFFYHALSFVVGAVIILAIMLPLYFTKNIDCTLNDNNPTNSIEYIYFGEYPQSIKADDVSVEEIAGADGYYMGSDGERYLKVDGQNDDEEASYFKIEKLKWRVLSKDNGSALIVCDTAIDNVAFQPYYSSSDNYIDTNADGIDTEYKAYLEGLEMPANTSANNYEYSYVRYFLNNKFFNFAFNSEEQGKILTTTVDNSIESTTLKENQFACNDTEDKVFLLSLKDIYNEDYGFLSSTKFDANRAFGVSNYAEKKGVTKITQEMVDQMLESNMSYLNAAMYGTFLGSCVSWLRSPSEAIGNYMFVACRGSSYYTTTDSPDSGVVPAMRIKIEG